jgi:hypothetical protein
MKKTILLIAYFVAQTFLAQTATQPSGDGSSGNPYQIATWQNLYWISQNSGEYSKYFEQTADINFNDASPAIATWDGGGGWTPINGFSGSYDGNGHTISNLYINRAGTNIQGFFGDVYGGCTIQNLTLENCSVTGRDLVGGLIARVYYSLANTSVNITDCHVTGTITTTYKDVGGLIGTISVQSGVTGGDTYNVFVSNCSVSATVSSEGYSGVLIGNCAGLSAPKNPRISKCFSSGSISSSGTGGRVGGLIGVFDYATISNCYSTASVSGSIGDDAGGGFLGSAGSGTDISYCYSTGTVSGFGDGDQYGFIGYYNTSSAPNISNCYWDTETSGYTNAGISWGVEGKTTAQMKTQSTFSGWSFDTVWEIVGGDGANYPRLKDNPDSALPVELSSFTAKVSGSEITLNWQTATEVNNYGFDIELKIGNGVWKSIGFVQGHGNSNSPKEYSFTDKPNSGNNFTYRLKQIDFDGKYEYSPEVEVNLEVPVFFSVKQNFPNPFNPTTTIKYALPSMGIVMVDVFNILGEKVTRLVNERKSAGYHEVKWNTAGFASGVYIYMIYVKTDEGNNDFRAVKKMILLK